MATACSCCSLKLRDAMGRGEGRVKGTDPALSYSMSAVGSGTGIFILLMVVAWMLGFCLLSSKSLEAANYR